jgi:hypothetical protein
VIEVRLGCITREFERLFSFVTNHSGVTACFTVALANASIGDYSTPADNE